MSVCPTNKVKIKIASELILRKFSSQMKDHYLYVTRSREMTHMSAMFNFEFLIESTIVHLRGVQNPNRDKIHVC